jgi:hypothetical protein
MKRPEHTRCPCHVCGRIVAHYPGPAGKVITNRGSHPHQCPHGVVCRGGDRLHRWGHQGYAPNCRPCSKLLQQQGMEGTPERKAMLEVNARYWPRGAPRSPVAASPAAPTAPDPSPAPEVPGKAPGT